MPTLESLIEQLKLSQDPLYQSLDPTGAEAWARELETLYEDPRNKLTLQRLGIDSASLLDGPLSAAGIQQAREHSDAQRDILDAAAFSLGGILPESMTQNIGGVGRGVGSVFEQFGLADADTSVAPKEAQAFGTSIPQLAGGILGNLAAFAPAAAGGGAGLLAAGASPTVASIGSFALAGGGLETLRQVGRNVGKGEPYSVGNILAETAIAGAGGYPTSRVGAALAAAGTAGAAGMLGADIDPKRVAGEALFALIFGNPQIGDLGTAGALEDPVFPTVRDPLKVDPAKLTDLDKALSATGTRRDGTVYIQPNQLTRLMMAAANVQDPTVRSVARTRFEATRELVETHTTDELRAVMKDVNEGPIVNILAADAHAQKEGLTRPIDAPASPHKVVPKSVQTFWDDADFSFAELFGARGAAQLREDMKVEIHAAREMGDTARIQEIEEMRWLTNQLTKGYKEVRQKGDFPQVVNERTVQQAANSVHAAEGRPFAQVSDDYMLRLDEINTKIGVLKAEGQPKEVIRDFENKRVLMTNELGKALSGNHTVENENIAQGVFELMLKAAESKSDAANMLAGMPTSLRLGDWSRWGGRAANKRMKEIMKPHERAKFTRDVAKQTQSMKEFGAEVQDPFRDTVNAIVRTIDASSVSRGHLRQLGGVSGLLEELAETIPNPFYKEFLKDIKPASRKKIVKEINSLLFQPAQLAREGVSLNQLRRQGFRYGANIADDLTVTAAGLSTKFKKLKDIGQYFQDIQSGKAVDPLTLRLEATSRGATVKHVGDGEHVVVDHNSGTIDVATSPEQAAQIIRDKPDLSQDAPDLTPGAPVTLSGASHRAGWNGEDVRLDHLPQTDLPGNQARIANLNIVRNLRNARGLAQDIESMTKGEFKAYTEFFLPLQQATEARAGWERPFTTDLQSMRRQVRRSKTSAIQEVLASPALSKEVAASHNLNSKEVKVVNALRKWYSNLLDIEPHKLAKTIQDFRRHAGDPNRAQSAFSLPAELEFARDGIMQGRVRLDNDNFVSVAADLMRERGNWLHIRGLQKGNEDFLKKVHVWARGRPERAAVYESMLHVRDAAMGNGNSSTQWLAEVINNGNFGILPTLRKMGFAKDVKPTDIDRAINNTSTYFSMTAMSARPALVIRNQFQKLLPAWKVGYGNNLRGIARAYKEGAEERALKAGAIGNDLTGVYLLDEMKGLDEGFVRRLHRAGLTWYRKTDRSNRISTFYSGVEAIERNAPRFMEGKGTWDDFLVRTGLAGDSDFIQSSVLRKLQNEGLDEAANFYGKFLTEETQFLYSKIAAPNMFQSTYGRMFGQFGIWPVQWYEYVSRNMGLGAQGNGLGSAGARRTYRAKFAARAAAQLVAISGMGAALGINTSTFNYASPFDYEGGPMVQAARDIMGTIGGSEYEKKMARANLFRSMGNFVLPFRSAVTDWVQASQEENPGMALLLALGFNPKER